MSRIFISYSNLDRERVEPYIDALKSAGFDVWWDRSLRAGDDWAEGIERELERADCIVIFWSNQSVTSPWVRIEAHQAKRKNRIVPVKLEAVELPDEYRAFQTLSAFESADSEFLQSLSRAIRDTIQRNSRRSWRNYALAAGVAIAALIVARGLNPTQEQQPPIRGGLPQQPAATTDKPVDTVPALWAALNNASSPQELTQLEQQFEQLLTNEAPNSEINIGSVHTLACRLSLRRHETDNRDSDLALAESQCGKARRLAPATQIMAETEGWLALETGQIEKAREHFNTAIALDDRASSAHIGLAAALENQGDTAAAEQALSAAVVLRPDYWRAHNELGLFLQRSGQLDAALKRLQLALDLNPNSAFILNNIGVTRIFQGEYAAAVTAWGQVLDLTPARDHGPTFTNIGSAYYLLRDFGAAKVAFEKASRLVGDDYRTWANLADSHRALGDEDQAILHYRRALDRANMVLASNAQDLHAAASALTFRSALDETGWEKELTKLLQQGADDAELHRLAALAYLRSDQRELAMANVQRAIELGFPAFFIADDYELASVEVP